MRPCQQCPPRCSCQPTSPAAALLVIVVSCSSAGPMLSLPKSPPAAIGASCAWASETFPQDLLLVALGEGSLPDSSRNMSRGSNGSTSLSRPPLPGSSP